MPGTLPSFFLMNIGHFHQLADIWFLYGIVKLAFYCTFSIHFLVVFCYHINSIYFWYFVRIAIHIIPDLGAVLFLIHQTNAK